MMRFAVGVAVLAVGGVLLADAAPLKQLEGTYKAVALVRAGMDESAERVAGTTAKIVGDEITFTVLGKSHAAKIKLDPKAKPATIDIAPSDGPEKGRTFPGIYKLEKGELVLAFTEKGDRPTEFKGEGDVLLVRLKRDNP